MKVDILASGSSGNSIAIRSGNSAILVDVGIAKTNIEEKLMEVGIVPNEIKGIFITHSHGDHIKGLPLANKYKIPVYAGEKEWQSMSVVDEDLRRIIKPGQATDFQESFYITAFRTHHDAYDSLGYAIQDYNRIKCSICLDTGHVDKEMLEAMEFSNIYVIEANHEPNMLEASNYPNSVKARILSHIGHLSNMQTAEALSKLVTGNGEQIYLTHLSSSNNMPILAQKTVMRELFKKGFKADKHYHIEVI